MEEGALILEVSSCWIAGIVVTTFEYSLLKKYLNRRVLVEITLMYTPTRLLGW